MSYKYPYVVPQLVEDVTLKRSRMETEEGDVIRVTDVNGGSTDLSPITDTLGATDDPATDSTVIGLLKNIKADIPLATDLSDIEGALGTTSDQSTDPTVIGLLKSIASKLQ